MTNEPSAAERAQMDQTEAMVDELVILAYRTMHNDLDGADTEQLVTDKLMNTSMFDLMALVACMSYQLAERAVGPLS